MDKLTMWVMVTLVAVVIYWDSNRSKAGYLSACHWADIKIFKDNAVCLECKKFCKIVNGWNNPGYYDIKTVNDVVEKNE